MSIHDEQRDIEAEGQRAVVHSRPVNRWQDSCLHESWNVVDADIYGNPRKTVCQRCAIMYDVIKKEMIP